MLYTTGILGGRSTQPPAAARQQTAGSSAHRSNQIPAASARCLEDYFKGISQDRVFELEEGTGDLSLIGREQPKEGLLGLRLTENHQTVGALRLSFFQSGEIFKIASIVDAGCGQVSDFTIAGRPGERRVMQNWDSLSLALGNRSYVLRLGYDSGELGVNKFARFIP